MAEMNFDGRILRREEHSQDKENYERLLSVYHTGTDVKRHLLEFYLRDKNIDLLNWLTNISTNFLQFEDIKKARRRSTMITPTDLGLNTIDTLLKYHCFDMFWDCCLLNTCLEDILNKHKAELYYIYQNSSRQHDLPSLSLKLTDEQWKLLFEMNFCFLISQEEDGGFLSACKGITVSCLDSYLNVLILNIVCPLFKAVHSLSECQIRISKTAVLEYGKYIPNPDFDDIWNKIERNILFIGKHCKSDEQFGDCIARIRRTRFNRTLVQDNRKCILEEAFNNPAFIDDKTFCERVQTELDHIAFEENINLAKRFCEREISVNLADGLYSRGAYTHCVLENADKDLQVRKSVCSTKEHSREQEHVNDKRDKDDIPERFNKHNYLKVVQLITDIGKDALLACLKLRLPAADYGQAFNGMKKRILPLLNNSERQLLYPDSSKYSGDLTDLDISLLCLILRNVNTIKPHKNGWGRNPEKDDQCLSADIDRMRTFKNKYVSHCTKPSLNENEFPDIWESISKCIVRIGGSAYTERTDSLLTSEINPVMENDYCIALKKLKELEREKERMNARLEGTTENLIQIKQEITMMNRNALKNPQAHEGLVQVPMNLRISGDSLPSVSAIKPEEFDNEDFRITSVKEGSIIIGLDVSPSAFGNVMYFINVIDILISNLLERRSARVIDNATLVVISMEILGLINLTPPKRHKYSNKQSLRCVKRTAKKMKEGLTLDTTIKKLLNHFTVETIKPQIEHEMCVDVMDDKPKMNEELTLETTWFDRLKPHSEKKCMQQGMHVKRKVSANTKEDKQKSKKSKSVLGM